jgi:hypothetical protein
MRSGLHRRVVNLERTRRSTSEVQGPVTVRSFLAKVEERMRSTCESFPEAIQALLAELRDDEVYALTREAEAAELALANGGPA